MVAVAREALRLAEANPEFEYSRWACVYVDGGEGSCLFGQALVSLGVDPALLVGDDMNGAGIETLVEHLWIPLGDGVVDPDILAHLDAAQAGQDVGEPWGGEFVAGRIRLFLEAVEA